MSGHILSTAELRLSKPDRLSFPTIQRLPIHLLLDGVQRSYNLGAIFRLCDALLIERLIICGVDLNLQKRKLVQAAQGAQNWVPYVNPSSAIETVCDLKQQGFQIIVAEITTASVAPERFIARFPLCVVVGNERIGVSKEIVDLADAAVAIPMQGMCNSMNVGTATAIILYQLSLQLRESHHSSVR
jgi:tRNA G18 (ribose-2'-O)-methylase SpoU